MEESLSELLSAISLKGVASDRCLWEHENTHLLSLVAHDDIWLVWVLVCIQDVSIEHLGLVKFILLDELMFDRGACETLGEGLNDSLLEGVELGVGLKELEVVHHLLILKSYQQALVGELK